MLTKDDINKIQILIVAGSRQVTKEIDKLKDDIQEVNKKIELLPTKEEYFDLTDKLMGEIKKSREEKVGLAPSI